MSFSPFAKRLPYQNPQSRRRRSTRVEVSVPVLLSGRDASGQTFRELTETSTVNLHGARVKTRNCILVGMQITAENPATGKTEKAICVRVEEPEPGESRHFIAIQLVHPCNLWQIENPPEDWARIQAELVDGVTAVKRDTGKVTIPVPGQHRAVVPGSRPDTEQSSADVEGRMAAIVESLVANLRKQSEEIVMEAFRQIEVHLEDSAARLGARVNAHAEQAMAEFNSSVETSRAEAAAEIARESSETFERHVGAALAAAESRMNDQATRMTSELESALETFRVDTMGEIVRDAVRNFEERMQGVVADGESRLAERCDRALAGLDKALESFRADVAGEFAARKNEVAEFTEQALRAKVATMLSSILGQSASTDMETNKAGFKK